MTAQPQQEDRSAVIVVPVLHRFHRIRPFLESLRSATPEEPRTIFVASAGDRQMIATVLELAISAKFGRIQLEVVAPNLTGDYARKVNHAIRCSSEPFIFTGADDLNFHPGWLPAALAPFDDPAIGVVGTQDLCNPRTIAGEHSTHLVFRRSYVAELGTIDAPGLAFHEGYPHEFVDDEAVATAKYRRAWSFAPTSVVEHLHPMNGKAPMDDLYRQQGQRIQTGRRIFNARQPLWTTPPERPRPDNVTIVVATFGEERWAELARTRAIPSAQAQAPAQLIVEHGPSLHEARNRGAAQARTEWLCFLDADDELEPGYLAAMGSTSGDLLAPAVRYVNPTEPPAEPMVLAARDINRVNPCVIGTLIRRQMFDDAGGFWPERAWEDWSLFRRCWLIGARIEHVPAAVYRANVDPAGGRNSTVENGPGLARQITNSHAQWHRRKRANQ